MDNMVIEKYGRRIQKYGDVLLMAKKLMFQEKKSNLLYDMFIAHPELNASAIARRLGISQSLFAQYISGTKKPSKKRFEEIIKTIRAIGRELMAVPA